MPILTYAKILADSISPQGIRLTTWEVCCHRWVLAEHNTHRVLSRNFRSSRAVPVAKLIEEVRTNPAMPIEWRKNQKGMVGGELMTPEEAAAAESVWRAGAMDAANRAEWLANMGLHKQWANRPLEPYLYVYGVVSTTERANLYHLRRAPDAQPEFRLLANKMWEAQEASEPKVLRPGEWHLPYINDSDLWVDLHGPEFLQNLSAARCARVSIRPFDGNADYESEMARAHRLMVDGHMSPFEHQATPDTGWYCSPQPKLLRKTTLDGWQWINPKEHGNFVGWRQYRKQLPDECVRDR